MHVLERRLGREASLCMYVWVSLYFFLFFLFLPSLLLLFSLYFSPVFIYLLHVVLPLWYLFEHNWEIRKHEKGFYLFISCIYFFFFFMFFFFSSFFFFRKFAHFLVFCIVPVLSWNIQTRNFFDCESVRAIHRDLSNFYFLFF